MQIRRVTLIRLVFCTILPMHLCSARTLSRLEHSVNRGACDDEQFHLAVRFEPCAFSDFACTRRAR
ncbi:NAD-dependent DNA ligase [Pseudomonas syringae pv. actinidiae]|uniref:NAD-dependent DNA ligase n=1 Tax=Pseudomonas syringae pv. actinidiae TaxID=103796 RepID=A0A2V0QCQ6_PSESF|nr:NAD-dependent DNA ligase [Pseudomonas syringae pv. actinidiae]